MLVLLFGVGVGLVVWIIYSCFAYFGFVWVFCGLILFGCWFGFGVGSCLGCLTWVLMRVVVVIWV